MRKYLLDPSLNSYKANLHCHSRLSDAMLTVEELKAAYKERGYSVIAFTDHDVLFSHYDSLKDGEFLPLTGYEISIENNDDPYPFRKVVHMNLISKTPNPPSLPYYSPGCADCFLSLKHSIFTREMADKVVVDGLTFKGDRQLYPAKINKIISVAKEKGFMVSLNHPNWSLLTGQECSQYEGLWAMEVYNNSCFMESGLPDDERVYDEILRSGKKIFALCTDDNHNREALDDPRQDSFGGFTVIKSPELGYEAVIKALETGNFYSSQGPEIKSVYFEDGKVHIECSPVREICMNVLTRNGYRKASHNCDMTHAEFTIDPIAHCYVRFKIIDQNGKCAYTNPYYLKDFFEVEDTREAIIG